MKMMLSTAPHKFVCKRPLLGLSQLLMSLILCGRTKRENRAVRVAKPKFVLSENDAFNSTS